MILLTLSRGKGEETVRLQLPASPAEIGEAFASLDRISLDTTATAILDVSSNVPVLYRCLYDVDVEDSEQFQKLQKLAERTEALSPAKAAIFSGALDAECVWNLEGALTEPYGGPGDFDLRGGVIESVDEKDKTCSVRGTFFTMEKVPLHYVLGRYNPAVGEEHYGVRGIVPFFCEDKELAGYYLNEVRIMWDVEMGEEQDLSM